MAKTIQNGAYLAAGGAAQTLHTAVGRLLAILASHSQTTPQVCQFYDATAATPGTQILVLSINPAQSPYYIEFPRNAAPEFTTALHVAQGNVDLLIWSVDHG